MKGTCDGALSPAPQARFLEVPLEGLGGRWQVVGRKQEAARASHRLQPLWVPLTMTSLWKWDGAYCTSFPQTRRT